MTVPARGQAYEPMNAGWGGGTREEFEAFGHSGAAGANGSRTRSRASPTDTRAAVSASRVARPPENERLPAAALKVAPGR